MEEIEILQNEAGNPLTQGPITNDKIFDMLFNEEDITWQALIYELVKTNQMNPWDIDVSILAKSFIDMIKKLKDMDFRISGKIVLASAILLKITSTSFPIVREDIAALCGISAHSSVVTKSDDSNHEDETKTVQSASENIIKELEAAGITTAQRQYVKKVSKDETDLVTPTFVLLKIVTCQQGLRMNAEDYFSSSEGINDNINNVLNVEQEKLETKLNELAKEVQESLQSSKSNVLALSKSSQENQKMVSIVLIILSVILALFFANMITKPVQKLTNAANKLTKGELDVKLLDKKTGDEIDNLNEGLQGVLGAIKFLSEEVESKQKGKK